MEEVDNMLFNMLNSHRIMVRISIKEEHMKKVLLATEKAFVKEAVDKIAALCKEAGYELVKLENYKDPKELIAAVPEADAMIIRSDKVDKAVLDAAKNLKIVVRAGAGYDNIDTKYAAEKKVVAMNTPGQNSNAVAELAFGMMLYAARTWFTPKSGTELRGKKLGIHAYGFVGRALAAIAKGFGMDIYAYDPFIDAAVMAKDGVKAVKTAEELYATCRYVSLHIPATEKTKKSIGYELLSKMPKGATLVNTARKEVMSEEGLLKMFAERPDFRYLSDVEDAVRDQILEKYKDRAFFTPKKMGAQTEEANINAGIAAARQIIAFFEKGDLTYKVN